MKLEELKSHYDKLLKDEDFDKLDLGLKNPNIFQILRITKNEIRHSNFLSWLLDPNQSHKLGDIFLKRFLREVFSSDKFDMIDQVDVEGMELEVLYGMRGTLASAKPYLLIEMQDPTRYSRIYEYLKGFGYYMYWMPVATFNANNHKNNSENVFGNQHGVVNWLCSATELNTTLQAVVDKDDTVERMVWRRSQNVGND